MKSKEQKQLEEQLEQKRHDEYINETSKYELDRQGTNFARGMVLASYIGACLTLSVLFRNYQISSFTDFLYPYLFILIGGIILGGIISGVIFSFACHGVFSDCKNLKYILLLLVPLAAFLAVYLITVETSKTDCYYCGDEFLPSDKAPSGYPSNMCASCADSYSFCYDCGKMYSIDELSDFEVKGNTIYMCDGCMRDHDKDNPIIIDGEPYYFFDAEPQ